jgi:hypothetical protein
MSQKKGVGLTWLGTLLCSVALSTNVHVDDSYVASFFFELALFYE